MSSSSPSISASSIGALVAIAVIVSGCSSSSADDDSTDDTAADPVTAVEPSVEASEPSATDVVDSGRRPGAVTLLDPGAEPRVPLAITTDARGRISVGASEELTTMVGDVTSSEAREAVYELDIDLQVGGGGVELHVVPTIVSLDGPVPTPDELGNWRWFLDQNGVVLRVVPIGRRVQVAAETLGLLSLANLVLTTPVEPVGPGAQWSQSLNRQTDARLVFTLERVTDTDLEVAVELVAPFDAGTATMVVSGSYDRETLLAREVTTDAHLEITSPVTDNGELVDLTGVQRSRRTFAEVTG